MAEKTLYIVQQFEKQGRKLVSGRQLGFDTEIKAIGRAERDAERTAGVLAVRQTVDAETGEVLDEPFILAQHGEIPAGIVQD